MSGRGKRRWPPRLGFDDAYKVVLEFLQNCHKNNLTANQESPTLLQSYLIDGTWPVDGMVDASTVLRFGFSRNPAADQDKQAMAKLLSVATRAHFFLTPQAIVTHEPFLFVMPDLGSPGQRRHGLIYPLENEGRTQTLMAAEWDLAMAGSRLARLLPGQKFPVVLSMDPFQWLSLRKWRELKKEAGDLPWFQMGSSRNRLLKQVREHTDLGTFNFGHVLNYPRDMNEDVKAVGAAWAHGIKRWFLPKGWDAEAVVDYLDRLEAMDADERQAIRWWVGRPRPRNEESD